MDRLSVNQLCWTTFYVNHIFIIIIIIWNLLHIFVLVVMYTNEKKEKLGKRVKISNLFWRSSQILQYSSNIHCKLRPSCFSWDLSHFSGKCLPKWVNHCFQVYLLKDLGIKKRFLCRSLFLYNIKQIEFHVAMCLFSNRSQMASKCCKKISDTLCYGLMCHFFVLTTFWRHLWCCITEQTNGQYGNFLLKCYWNEIFVSYFIRSIYSFNRA